MAKLKDITFTPGEWYADGDCVGSLDDREELVGDVVCMAPEEFENSMEYWSANVRLLAQAKVMHQLISETVKKGHLTEDWFNRAGEVLEAIQ
jgi:hypothetical protein